jgi:hypothetical protein
MERELWPVLYRLVREAATGVYRRGVVYQPWALVLVFLWAALHDRPVSWACDRANWRATRLRPPAIPSASTLSRRVGSVGVGLAWRAVGERVRATGDPALIAVVDGKPLPVGGDSHDPAAAFGRGAGCVARGYERHAVWAGRAVPEAWEVTAMSGCEKAAAGRLLGQLGRGGYLLADGNYDASWLYDAAAARGYQLVARCRRARSPGCGKHYQSPHRRRAIELLRGPFGRDLYRLRTRVERAFGHAGSFAGGLQPLPSWVRGAERVRTWVWAKLLINAARILTR